MQSIMNIDIGTLDDTLIVPETTEPTTSEFKEPSITINPIANDRPTSPEDYVDLTNTQSSHCKVVIIPAAAKH